MKNSDGVEFAKIMYGVADNFGGQISEQGMDLRFEALRKLNIMDVSAAATWIMSNRTATYPPVPTVKEFLDAAEMIRKGPQLSLESSAEIQAGLILGKLKRDGRNADLSGLDEIAEYLMTRRWSYQSWASTVLESELVWWRKEFIEAYRATHESGRVEETRILMGIANPVAGIVGGIGNGGRRAERDDDGNPIQEAEITLIDVV